MRRNNFTSFGDLRRWWSSGIALCCLLTCGSLSYAQQWRIVGWLPGIATSHSSPAGIDFVDEQHGWVVDNYAQVYRTSDGGQTWQKTTTDTAEHLVHLAFADRAIGFLVITDVSLDQPNQVEIRKTSDGGMTWNTTLRDSSTDKGHYLVGNDIVSATSDVIYVASVGIVFKSTDSGNSWQVIRTPVKENPDSASGRNDDWYAISCTDAQHCWLTALDYSGRMIHTTDGGNNWQEIVIGRGNQDIVAVSDSVVYICSEKTFYASTDAGTTWRIKDLYFRQFPLFECWQMRFISPERGHIAASRTILTTTDGGLSFTYDSTIVNKVTQGVGYIDCIPSGTCWAISGDGIVLRSDALSGVGSNADKQQALTLLTVHDQDYLLHYPLRWHDRQAIVVDLLGRQVLSHIVPAGTESLLLRTRSLPSGTFFVRLDETTLPLVITH